MDANYLILIFVIMTIAAAAIYFVTRRHHPKPASPTALIDEANRGPQQILQSFQVLQSFQAAALRSGDKALLPFAGTKRTGRVVAIRGRRVILAVTHRSGRQGIVRRKLHEVSPAN